MFSRYVLFLITLVVITLIRLWWLSIPVWPINGDEAQYWLWSQQLAFGYYSKPPVLAWLIAVSNGLFGKTALGLRFFSPLLQAGTGFLIYQSGRLLFDEQVGFWAGISYFLAPGVLYASQLMTTDTPLLFFYALAFYLLICILKSNKTIHWILLGFALGLALLSKYIAIFFVFSFILSAFLIKVFENKILTQVNKKKKLFFKFLLSPKILWALFFCILIIIPNLVWNAHHHFVSFQAVDENADIHGIRWNYNNLLNFFFSQWIIFNPILFVSFLITFFKIKNYIKDQRYILLYCFSFPVFLAILAQSFVSQAHANWASIMYVTAPILVAAFLVKNKKITWLKWAMIFNFFIFTLFFQVEKLMPYGEIHTDAGMSQVDWSELKSALNQAIKVEPTIRMITDDRLLFSNTVYFTDVTEKQIWKWNPTGQVHDHFDMIHSLKTADSNPKQKYLLITYEENQDQLFSQFQSHYLYKKLHIPLMDGDTVVIYLFYLQGFRGY